MSSTETIGVLMKRGGYVPLVVTGSVYKDTDGAGQSWTQVEVKSVQWPGGGRVAEKNITDMTQVEDDFKRAVIRRATENLY